MDQVKFVKDSLENFEMIWSAHITANFLKAVLHKLYLVHSWIPWPFDNVAIMTYSSPIKDKTFFFCHELFKCFKKFNAFFDNSCTSRILLIYKMVNILFVKNFQVISNSSLLCASKYYSTTRQIHFIF